MQLIEFIFMLFCLLLICLLMEKLFHMKYSLTECAGQLRTDIIQISKIFLCGEVPQQQVQPIRHVFEDFFVNHIESLVKPYANEAIGIGMRNEFYNGVPSIIIGFAPASNCSDADIKKLKNILLSELKKYSNIRGGLFQDIFGDYSQDGTYIYIVLYYAELKEDFEVFQKRKQIYIEEHRTPKNAVLRDESLDKELSAVGCQEVESECD